MSNAPSWGRLVQRKRTTLPFDPKLKPAEDGALLAYGNGRSYGDSCHNDRGSLVVAGDNRQILEFDPQTGRMAAQAGVLLSDILNHISDSGWFLPVVPGTKFITLGGAIANDIHGKNHEKRGTFGRHVTSFQLWRSSGSMMTCSAAENADLFAATIGGMGLTGYIVSAEIQLMKVPSHHVSARKRAFGSLDDYFDGEREFIGNAEYSVAWVDSLARGKNFGRGILMAADHAPHEERPHYGPPKLSVPLTPPLPLVSGLPLRVFNMAYFHRNGGANTPALQDPNSYFFPLDGLAGWNRLYGPKGLFQHQSVVPLDGARQTLSELLTAGQEFGQGSFLTVLKRFGDMPSPGLMSFPTEGYTLTLDFANRGAKSRALLQRLDDITLAAGGRINPYKDGRMSADTFQAAFPHWTQLENLRDPAFQSDFWRRVSRNVEAPRAPLQAPSMESPVNHAGKDQLHTPGLKRSRDKTGQCATAMGTK